MNNVEGIFLMGLDPGRAIREYDVLGIIRNSDSNGNLYAARHRLLGTPCSIREVPAKLKNEKATCDWMLREARVFSEFNHPSVSRLIQCFEDNGELYLVYDFLDGMLLSSILKRGALSPSQAVKVSLAIGRGLEAAHQHQWNIGDSAGFGIPHGNLSADVVVVGGDSNIKIFDFSPLGSVSNTGSDRYALGRLLARMLTGAPQWNDDDYGENLPPLPATLRDLLDGLLISADDSEALEFTEFLPHLEEISLAYDEGGMVPRCAIDLSMEMEAPLPIACHGARKRLYVGDSGKNRVGKYNYKGELEQLHDDLDCQANGLVFMPGYGLYVFGKEEGSVSLISMAGQISVNIDGYEFTGVAGSGKLSEDSIIGAARVSRGTFILGDNHRKRLLFIDAAGAVTKSIGGGGGEDDINFASVGPVASNMDLIVVIDDKDCVATFFDSEGNKLRSRNLRNNGIESPAGCDLDNLGNFYVTDKLSGKLVIIESDGGVIEFDSLVVNDFISICPGDVSLAENGSLVIISDPVEKVVLMYDNYFYLSALEKTGGCKVCGFISPEGVSRCLVCEVLENIFPVPDSDEDEESELEDFSTRKMVELEDDLMYQSMIEAGEVEQVIEPLKKRLIDEPDNTEVLMLLGSALAIKPLVKPLYALGLIKDLSKHSSSAYLLSSLSAGLGSKDCAQGFLQIFKSNKGGKSLQHDLEERIANINLKSISEGSLFFSGLATMCEQEQLIDSAIMFYSWLLEINQNDYGVQASLGRLYLREQHFDRAKEHFDWMFAHNRYDVEALEVLTCLLNRGQEWHETYDILQRFFHDPRIADKLIAGHGMLRYNYGVALRSLGKNEESSKEIGRAKRLGFAPLSPDKIKSLFAYQKSKDHKQVVKIGDELCLEFEFFRWPDGDISRNIIWKIAGAYEKLGDLKRAMRTYRIFIRNFPTHPASSQADRTVAALALKAASN